MCVEVDLNKPFLAKFCLRGKVRRIEYEAFHSICFKCWCYGHHQEDCLVSVEQEEKVEVSQQSGVREDVREGSKVSEAYALPGPGLSSVIQRDKGKGVDTDLERSTGLRAGFSRSKGMKNSEVLKQVANTKLTRVFILRIKVLQVAAAIDFHVLVQGNNSSKEITCTTVSHASLNKANLEPMQVTSLHEGSYYHNPCFPHPSKLTIDGGGKNVA
ncbi:hypothetical protein PTKIN_Ptkin04bG0096800 [Pterospermum kingtungense]